MFMTYEMTVKSKCKIIEFVIFSIGIILYIKIEARNNKMHQPEPLIGETNFLGRDRDREIRLIKTHYETETEK